jgi:hypothetical protein
VTPYLKHQDAPRIVILDWATGFRRVVQPRVCARPGRAFSHRIGRQHACVGHSMALQDRDGIVTFDGAAP